MWWQIVCVVIACVLFFVHSELLKNFASEGPSNTALLLCGGNFLQRGTRANFFRPCLFISEFCQNTSEQSYREDLFGRGRETMETMEMQESEPRPGGPDLCSLLASVVMYLARSEQVQLFFALFPSRHNGKCHLDKAQQSCGSSTEKIWPTKNAQT